MAFSPTAHAKYDELSRGMVRTFPSVRVMVIEPTGGEEGGLGVGSTCPLRNMYVTNPGGVRSRACAPVTSQYPSNFTSVYLTTRLKIGPPDMTPASLPLVHG